MLCRCNAGKAAIDIGIGTATNEVGQAATDSAEPVSIRINGTDRQSELFSSDCRATTAGGEVNRVRRTSKEQSPNRNIAFFGECSTIRTCP